MDREGHGWSLRDGSRVRVIYTIKIKQRRSPACFVTSFNKKTPAFVFQNYPGIGLFSSASLILATLILFSVLFSPPD